MVDNLTRFAGGSVVCITVGAFIWGCVQTVKLYSGGVITGLEMVVQLVFMSSFVAFGIVFAMAVGAFEREGLI